MKNSGQKASWLSNVKHAIREWRIRHSGGTFFVDQLSAEELALFHDPERP